MKVAIGADHAGFAVKEELRKLLGDAGHEVIDAGPPGEESVDYPDFAEAVARSVSRGDCERGILVCGTGIGMSMAANKVPGVRAALCHNTLTAEMSRKHNDANVLCVGARVLPGDEIRAIVAAWLETSFEGGRHARRVGKIDGLDRR
ncbi:MAG: ribose 5-phosphate isomerase B [Planctomycetota bacterium]|jgi:ribose 5-phosphate isomerase B